MPCLIICKTADGRILANAMPGDPPQEYLQDAEQVESLEVAAQLVTQVLGDEQPATGEEQPAPNAGNDAPADEEYGGSLEGTEGMPMESEDDQMEAGFKRAKKGH